MTAEPAPKRRLPLGLIGAVLILIAGGLIATAMIQRRRPPVDAGAEARSACRAFEDVYAATRPGAPMNGRELARKLEQAIDGMGSAASVDTRWRELAQALDELGAAVNAGDTARSYATMERVHADCADTFDPTSRNA